MMQVWLVESGERGEGGSVRGLYFEEDKAFKAVLGMQAVMDYTEEPWVEEELPAYAKSLQIRRWTSGCDWICMGLRAVQ